MANQVIKIDNDEQLPRELTRAGSKLVVVDCMANWCGPCQTIKPFYNSLPSKYPGAVFLQLDVDVCQTAAAQYSVRALPTFLYFKNSQKIDQVVGPNTAEIEDKIRLHDGDTPVEDCGVKGHVDLVSFIYKGGCECLNESDDHTMSHAVFNDGGYLESDCDEQLIMSLAFTQPLKLHSIKIKAPEDKGPKTLKLFINQPRTLDFDQADSMEPAQIIEMDQKSLVKNEIIPLRYVKFQNVQNLQIFVKDNQTGAETTQIDNFVIIGMPLNATNMGDFKRVAGKKGESH